MCQFFVNNPVKVRFLLSKLASSDLALALFVCCKGLSYLAENETIFTRVKTFRQNLTGRNAMSCITIIIGWTAKSLFYHATVHDSVA